jgi:ribulose-phosphate 3-epimerase
VPTPPPLLTPPPLPFRTWQGFDISLEIDGGVTTSNIKEIAEAGVDMFVAGSAIFNSDDYKTTIDAMRAELAAAEI